MRREGHIILIEPEISGGKISRERIDELKDTEGDKVSISGLRQDTLEYLVSTYGRRFKEIEFWKCPLVQDLSPLEDLECVEKISYFWNQKAESLWRLSKNVKLTELAIENFNGARDLEPLVGSLSLERLSFGNGAWGKYGVLSLEPLTQLQALTHLDMNPKVIEDNKARPLTKMIKLRSLDFNNRLFTTEKVAWLKAHLPDHVESERLAPFVHVDVGLEQDVLVVGKRKPFLNSQKDAVRLAKYVDKFNSLVAYYRENLEVEEPK